jgi:hypothetical protein
MLSVIYVSHAASSGAQAFNIIILVYFSDTLRCTLSIRFLGALSMCVIFAPSLLLIFSHLEMLSLALPEYVIYVLYLSTLSMCFS